MTNPSPLSLREAASALLEQWDRLEFAAIEIEIERLRAALEAATPLTAPVASEPTWKRLDIMEAIAYCYKTLGHPQGTKGCIAFARGAEWAMDKLRAAPQTPSPVAPALDEQTRWQLHRFLDVAAGEGYELGGVDAADLFCKLFEDGEIAAIGAAPNPTEER